MRESVAGERNGRAVLTAAKAAEVLRRIAAGESYRAVARALLISPATVGRVARRETWQVIEEWTPSTHTVTVKPERAAPIQMGAIPLPRPTFAMLTRFPPQPERYASRSVVPSSAPEDDDWMRESDE